MTDGDLGEADPARQLGRCLFVRWVGIAVKEHDGRGADAVCEGGLEVAFKCGQIEAAFDFAGRAHAFVRFDHARIEHLGLDDLTGENVGSRLGADFQLVGKSLRDH